MITTTYSNSKSSSYTKCTVYIAMCVALLSVSSNILIPLPFNPVPINLASMTVLLIGCLLGPVLGSICIIVYIFMGMVGIPVYSGMGAGLGHLMGPTGGFLFGYIPAAFISGWTNYLKFDQNKTKSTTVAILLLSNILATCILYTVGALFFMKVTNTSLSTSISTTVIPFILGDSIKIILASILVIRLKKLRVF